MNNGSGFDLQFQAKSSAELLKKYKVKVENAKTSTNHYKASGISQTKGSCSKQELKKSSTSKHANNGNAIQTPRHTQMQNNKQDQRKPSLTIGSANNDQADTGDAIQKLRHIQMQNSTKNHRKQSLTIESAKNDRKRQLKATIGNQDHVTMEEQQASKKKNITLKCPPMSLDEFLNKNKKQVEEEPQDEEGEETDEEGEENDKELEVEENINYEDDEVDKTNDITTEGPASKGKRGKTKCLKVHARSLDDRQEIIFSEFGEPVGPGQKAVVEFSHFLGTVARSADFCPLTYTNWKALSNKDLIWAYVNQKYIIPEKEKKAVLTIINDAWRRYKCVIKKNHFDKYKTFREQMKNRPKDVPEAHFKILMEYWRMETVQEISKTNAKNRGQQKCRHRTGPVSFAHIMERMRATYVNQEFPDQLEMFFETRQSKKGKQLDQDTIDTITKLKDLTENNGLPPKEAFQTVFGKEKPGRVRCGGRTTTTTLLKRREEIAEIEKRHANEVKNLNEKVEEVEEKHKQEMLAMNKKLQFVLRTVIDQNNSGLNVEALAAFLTTPDDANSALRSFTSKHAPNNYEKNHGLANQSPLDANMLDVEEDEDANVDS